MDERTDVWEYVRKETKRNKEGRYTYTEIEKGRAKQKGKRKNKKVWAVTVSASV
jgi:hypothetical protein